MRSATRRKRDNREPSQTAAAKPAARPKLGTVGPARAGSGGPAVKRSLKTFHASMQVTRVEEWFVEAETAEEARRLLETGQGQRSRIGECLHFEIGSLAD